MDSFVEKRAFGRHRTNAHIIFSYFNKEAHFDALTINHCVTGMCFISTSRCQRGATVYIRTKEISQSGSYAEKTRIFRSVTLAEIKWCHEYYKKNKKMYAIGAKYFGPEY